MGAEQITAQRAVNRQMINCHTTLVRLTHPLALKPQEKLDFRSYQTLVQAGSRLAVLCAVLPEQTDNTMQACTLNTDLHSIEKVPRHFMEPFG